MKKIFLILLIIFSVFPSLSAEQIGEEIVFIVHAENPATSLSVTEVRDYYFKRKRQWPSGESVRFIDRGVGSRVRNVFLKNVLGKTGSEVDLFWIGQKLYTGDSAPLREATDSNTLQFVSSFKGAIGYVSSTAKLEGKTVKAIKVRERGE